MQKRWVVLGTLFSASLASAQPWPLAVVTDGRFTNVYVYPSSDTQTWEQHIASLRPADAAQFSRAAIDRFTEDLMSPAWPSYFDALFQYDGIRPPRFFGSAVAPKSCVDAALRDLNNGVMQWDTVRSLSNCHEPGRDPSPQVNLIFSPTIQLAKITPVGSGGDMCTTTTTRAWHAWGLNTPNFSAMSTSVQCMPDFTTFTRLLTHELVEILSDPGGTGFGKFGVDEVADRCETRSDGFGRWRTHEVSRYWSESDGSCQPQLYPGAGTSSQTWILGGSPVVRFTGDVHTVDLAVPSARTVTSAAATDVRIVVQTGSDDLRGGSNDNVDVTLKFAGGSSVTKNVNGGRRWARGQTHAAALTLPAGVKVSDITGVTLTTAFRGGFDGDNWDVNRVALVVTYPDGSPTTGVAPPIVHTWLDVSGAPLVRFTGEVHDHRVAVPPMDVGWPVQSLTAIISTGNDDLRGGNDNVDVIIELTDGKTLTVPNANGGQPWEGWTDHEVAIPIPAGMLGGQIAAVRLHTQFGGGFGGDNWNVNRLQLRATVTDPTVPKGPPGAPPKSCATCASGGSIDAVTATIFGVVALRLGRRRSRRDRERVPPAAT